MTFVERRGAPRAKFTGITFISAGPFKFPCIAGDLSETGMLIFIPTTNVIEPGLQLNLTFTLPTLSSWIVLDGTVVRQMRQRSRTSVGIHFNQVPGDIQCLLRAFVGMQHSAATIHPAAGGNRPPGSSSED